jgi:O-antigen/teichoic acid export membrane protein
MIKLFLKFSVGSWVSAAISLFTTPIVTALIIPDEFGKASMYTLAFNLVLQIALLGMDQGFVRKFYQQANDDYQSKLLWNSIALPFGIGLLLCLGIFLFGHQLAQWLVGAYSNEFLLLLCGSIMFGLFERFALLMLRMKKLALSFSVLRILAALINFLGIFLYATYVNKDFYAIIYGNFLSLLIPAIVAIVMAGNVWRLKKTDGSLIKDLLRYGFPFLPTFLVLWVFEGIDKMALRHYSNFHEIGLFSAAYKIVAILNILQASFSNFWTPVAFEMYEKNSEEAKQMFSRIFSLMTAILFTCGLGVILCKDIIILLFDESYRSAATIMPFLLLVPMMYILSEVTVGGINYKNKTGWHLVIAIASALTNYLLILWLVPLYGAKGAAVSTGISYIVFFYSRTIISHSLFPLDIKYSRFHITVMIFLGVSFLNAFYSNQLVNYLSAGAAILLVAILYRTELLGFQKTMTAKFRSGFLAVEK